jgi:cytochrome P450
MANPVHGAAGCLVRTYRWSCDGLALLSGFTQFGAAPSPVFFTDDAQGYHAHTEYEAIVEGLQRTHIFSSSSIQTIDPNPALRWISEMLDLPEHSTWRRLLSPLFTLARARAVGDDVRQHAARLIRRIPDHRIPRGREITGSRSGVHGLNHLPLGRPS